MKEIDDIVASIEGFVAEVSSDKNQYEQISEDEEEEQQATTMLEMEEEEEDASAATALASNRTRFRRRLRVGRPSWWTECKNIETSGCSFVFGYVVLSFVLMTTMFNMREIVGDYCLGNKERKDRAYRANVEKAMGLRRRSPLDQEDRFEEEIEAQLYYDKQGDDTEHLRNHRVPIVRPTEEIEDDEDDLLLQEPEP